MQLEWGYAPIISAQVLYICLGKPHLVSFQKEKCFKICWDPLWTRDLVNDPIKFVLMNLGYWVILSCLGYDRFMWKDWFSSPGKNPGGIKHRAYHLSENITILDLILRVSYSLKLLMNENSEKKIVKKLMRTWIAIEAWKLWFCRLWSKKGKNKAQCIILCNIYLFSPKHTELYF